MLSGINTVKPADFRIDNGKLLSIECISSGIQLLGSGFLSATQTDVYLAKSILSCENEKTGSNNRSNNILMSKRCTNQKHSIK